MKVEIKHNLPKEKAIPCAENIFKDLSEKYKDEFSDLEQRTENNRILFSFKARGMNIAGTITINENNVYIESRLPFAAKLFQGLIESKIKENAHKMLANCK
ncbi:MAG: polyhydroxyalkanoic acid system family protein [Bacteroidales bacterium]|nr:polyhydroxyalkanoic acid system family protein [Bacteroidales bacterium]